VTEILAMAGDSEDIQIPPTLNGLLAARLDQLNLPERRVLEHGAVEGEVFHRGAVQALTPEERHVTPLLATLTREELIRPDTAQLPGEDGFRFRHLLIRDVAYDSLPKSTRADLHRAFAAWLEDRGSDLVELDEMVGYHLEQAHLYRVVLGMPADRELAAEARRHLAAAGRRAHLREDFGAAASLLERAAELATPAGIDVRFEIDLVDALFSVTRADDALQRARAMAERAAATGDRIGELCMGIKECEIRGWIEPEGAFEQMAVLVDQALPVFEAAGDDFALYVGYRALGQVADWRGQADRLATACDRAAVHAARAGVADSFVYWRAYGRLWGATPASEVLAWLDEQDEYDRDLWILRKARVWMTAMLGRFDEARAMFVKLRADLAERGPSLDLAVMPGLTGVHVELLAGDPAAAAALGEEACRQLEQLGQKGALSTVLLLLGEAYYELGRLDEADATVMRAVELGASDDIFNQILWRQIRAKVLAQHGEPAEAERLAREAVAIAEETEWLNDQARAYADLGEVLALNGRAREAADAFGEALARFERRENLAMAARVRANLERLRQGARG
jgi:tetratricopeptide (TPR) repeat protein